MKKLNGLVFILHFSVLGRKKASRRAQVKPRVDSKEGSLPPSKANSVCSTVEGEDLGAERERTGPEKG